jgi:hypothetical protein
MYRTLLALTVAGLLVACTSPGGGATDPSLEADSSMATTESAAASRVASTACEEAFAPLAEAEVSSMSDLGDLGDDVVPTLESCESVDDWVAGAQALFDEEVDPDTARFLLGMQCADPSLADTPICEELAAS